MHRPDVERLAGLDAPELDARPGQLVQRHREVRGHHLALQHVLHAASFAPRTVEDEAVLRLRERSEEGQTLEMVVVVVGQQDVGLHRPTPVTQVVPEPPDSRAGVEDDPPGAGPHLHAGGVAAVLPSPGSRRRERPAHAPERDLEPVRGACVSRPSPRPPRRAQSGVPCARAWCASSRRYADCAQRGGIRPRTGMPSSTRPAIFRGLLVMRSTLRTPISRSMSAATS